MAKNEMAMREFFQQAHLIVRALSVRLLVGRAVVAVLICGCGQEEEELDRTKSGAFKLEKTGTHPIAC